MKAQGFYLNELAADVRRDRTGVTRTRHFEGLPSAVATLIPWAYKHFPAYQFTPPPDGAGKAHLAASYFSQTLIYEWSLGKMVEDRDNWRHPKMLAYLAGLALSPINLITFKALINAVIDATIGDVFDKITGAYGPSSPPWGGTVAYLMSFISNSTDLQNFIALRQAGITTFRFFSRSVRCIQFLPDAGNYTYEFDFSQADKLLTSTQLYELGQPNGLWFTPPAGVYWLTESPEIETMQEGRRMVTRTWTEEINDGWTYTLLT